MPSLKNRFEQFILSIEDAESVDNLLRYSAPIGRNLADFLTCDRRVIIEQKSIEVNPDYKIQRFFEKLASEGRLPQGDFSLGELLNKIRPDGERLFNELRERVTRILEDVVEKSNKQIRDTKAAFQIPEALGVVIILNENASLIFPDLAVLRLFDAVRKRRSDGKLRYAHIHTVILISEAHALETKDATMLGMATVYSDSGNEIPFATRFAQGFSERWAAFNGAGYLDEGKLWDNLIPRDPVKPIVIIR